MFHVDCDWKRGGVATPAPQCVVACSPSHVDGVRVYAARFANVESDVEEHEKRAGSCSEGGGGGRREGALQNGADVVVGGQGLRYPYIDGGGDEGGGAPLTTGASTAGAGSKRRVRLRPLERPYKLPRRPGDDQHLGHSSSPPISRLAFDQRSSGPEQIEVGDVLLFGHLTAHEFTQYPCPDVGVRSGAAAAAAAASAAGPHTLPLEWTRTAEYPTLVSPVLHGTPHQSKEEVLAALLTGHPPNRWAHVYTGNAHPGEGLFRPALGSMPAVPSTPLARCLVGLDDYALCPHATEWLLKHEPGSDVAATAVRQQLHLHRRLMLSEQHRALRRRLRRLAASKDVDLLIASEVEGRVFAQRSSLASPAASAVEAAARSAMRMLR